MKTTFKITVKGLGLLLAIMLLGATTSKAQLTGGVNLGLYGGATTDLAYMKNGSLLRLFATVESPASLFYSDNNGHSWTRAFPEDSLEFSISSSPPGKLYGWGGGGRKIVTNNNGWVGVLTQQHGGNLSSAVLSLNNGDFNSFFTVLDEYYLNIDHPSAGVKKVTDIAMNDYKFFVAMEDFLYSYDPVNKRNSIANLTLVTGMPAVPYIASIAVSNSTTGYPIYLVVTSSPNAQYGDLYKFNGTTFTKIILPKKAQKVFTHPALSSGNTVIVSGIDPNTSNLSVLVSTNGGSSWADRTPTGMLFPLSDVEYSPAWVSSMPVSNGLRIVLPGRALSDDLGINWSFLSLVNSSFTTDPDDKMKIMGTMGYGPVFSSNGPAGTFQPVDNIGLAAVSANKIAKYTASAGNAIYYLSTNSGLAYTDAYYNNSVPYPMKWKPPHGDFPIANAGDDAGVSAVAIDPNDPNHVVAGYSNGFSVKKTATSGFTNITPAGWNSPSQYDQMVTDIKFVNSNTVIATTGSGKNQLVNGYTTGNIWLSTDGGNSWSKVTPAGLQQANCVAVGSSGGTTVIYVGTGHYDTGGGSVNGAIWKSTNYGATWAKVNDGPHSIINSAVTKLPVYDIIVKNGTYKTLFIAAGKNLDHAFVYSTDGGATYNYTNVTGEGEFSSVFQYDANRFFVANRREIFDYNFLTNTYSLAVKLMPGEFAPDMEKGSLVFATNTGVYKLEVDSLNGIAKNKSTENQIIKIVPNPNNGNFEIMIKEKEFSPVKLHIYDARGMEVYSCQIDTKQSVKINGLSSGLYFAIIENDKGRSATKFVIKK